MPFCPKCSVEYPQGANFCPSCGEPASEQCAANEGTLTLKRLHSFSAAMMVTKVKINGATYGELRIDEELSIKLPYGTHTVELKVALNPVVVFQITISSQNDHVFYPFKIGASGKAVYAGDAPLNTSSVAKPKKKKSSGVVVALLIVFAVFIVIRLLASPGSGGEDRSPSQTASNSTSTSSPTPTPDPIFTPVSGTIGHWELTVNDFDYKKSVSAGVLTEYKAEEGSKYCIVSVTVKNTGKEMDTFLPIIAIGNQATAKIQWKDYEYTRSELIWSKANLSTETLNPLVSTTGNIAFELPDEVINSDVAPILVVQAGDNEFRCELKKELP